MSDITKGEGYTFGRNGQQDINSLGEASKKFYELVLPVFEGRDFAEVRGVFIDTPRNPAGLRKACAFKGNQHFAQCFFSTLPRPIILGATYSVSKAIRGISHEFVASQR